MTRPYRLTDAETEDLKLTVHTLAETIRCIALAQGWGYRPLEQIVFTHTGAALDENLPALRRTFLLLEER